MIANREAIADASNPLGLDGIEYIEYATSKPQALGQALEMMGFRRDDTRDCNFVLGDHQGRQVDIHSSYATKILFLSIRTAVRVVPAQPRNGLCAGRHRKRSCDGRTLPATRSEIRGRRHRLA